MKLLYPLIYILFSSIFQSYIYSDYTYFDYDKLVFGNAGGFELAPTDDGTYILQVLNISGSDSEYKSKGFQVDGKFISVVPVTGDAYDQGDVMEMTNSETFTSTVVPQIDDENFPVDMIFFTGEYKDAFMLLNKDTISGYKMVTSDKYESDEIYFQEDYGTMYMGVTSEDLPVLSIFPTLDNKVYWGINTVYPVSMVTVSGNFKVDGTVITAVPFGVMESKNEVSGLPQFDNVVANTEITSLDFELEGFTSANIIVLGQVNSAKVSSYGTWMNAYMNLEYFNGTSWVEYLEPSAPTHDIKTRTLRSTDAGTSLKGHHLTPFFSTLIDIDPNGDGSPALYRATISLITNGGGSFFTDLASISILGLPSGSFNSLSSQSPNFSSSTEESDLIPQTSFSEIDGNYLTNQMIAFGSGGSIIESGDALVFSDGTNYLDFKAETVDFGEYHKVDTLKITNDANSYNFQIGDSAGANLGFHVDGDFYGNLSTQNIQTLTTQTALDTPLFIESDVYIADNSLILTNGTVSPNVEIGDVISDSSIVLNIEDDLLFTGHFDGSLMEIRYKEVIATNYSSVDLTGGSHLHTDTLSITLAEGGTWSVMIYAFLTSRFIYNVENSLAIHMEGPGGVDYYTTKTTMDVSNGCRYGTMVNIGSFTNLPGGDYEVHLDVRTDRMDGSSDTLKTDPNNDGNHQNGTTFFQLEYGGAIGLVAMPGE
jgi:hypothetical protein